MQSLKLISSSSFSIAKDKESGNRDALLPPKRIGEGYLMAVADGVGKSFGAEIAAKEAISFLNNIRTEEELYSFQEIFLKIRQKLISIANETSNYSAMATTLTACFVSKNGILIGHTGDSRAYLTEKGKLEQLTKDQTEHEYLISIGAFTREKLKNHPRKNVLISALSPKVDLMVEEFSIPYKPTSIYVMTDGAYNFWEASPNFGKETMKTPNFFCAYLERRIIAKGPIDDASVVAASFG